jgi:hypothetical protein
MFPGTPDIRTNSDIAWEKDMWATGILGKGIVYDAPQIANAFRIPCTAPHRAPQARDGEIIVYYDGWSLKDLARYAKGSIPLYFGSHHTNDEWYARPGYYRLRLVVAGSERKTWRQQYEYTSTIDSMLRPAPITVAMTGLLVHVMTSGTTCHPDRGRTVSISCRCAETPEPGEQVGFVVRQAMSPDDFRFRRKPRLGDSVQEIQVDVFTNRDRRKELFLCAASLES